MTMALKSEGQEVLKTNSAESTGLKSTPVVQRDESPTIDSSLTAESTTEESCPMSSTPNNPWHSINLGNHTPHIFSSQSVIAGVSEGVRVFFGSWLM
jgi:hypothetical protein